MKPHSLVLRKWRSIWNQTKTGEHLISIMDCNNYRWLRKPTDRSKSWNTMSSYMLGDQSHMWQVVLLSRPFGPLSDQLGLAIFYWTSIIQTPEPKKGAMRFGVPRTASPSPIRLLAFAYVSSHPWLKWFQAAPANLRSSFNIWLRFWCLWFRLRWVFVIQYIRRRPLVKLWGWIEAQVRSAYFLGNYLFMLTHRTNPNLSQSMRSPEEIRQLEETLASIRLHTRHHDPYEEWEKRTRKAAFVSHRAMNYMQQAHCVENTRWQLARSNPRIYLTFMRCKNDGV